PQETLREVPEGESRDVTATRRYDLGGDSLSRSHDVVLFPCASLEEPTDGDFRLTDANDDGRADGIESTDADAAAITSLNGEAPREGTGQRDVEPNADGHIDVTVQSDGEDC